MKSTIRHEAARVTQSPSYDATAYASLVGSDHNQPIDAAGIEDTCSCIIASKVVNEGIFDDLHCPLDFGSLCSDVDPVMEGEDEEKNKTGIS